MVQVSYFLKCSVVLNCSHVIKCAVVLNWSPVINNTLLVTDQQIQISLGKKPPLPDIPRL